VIGSEVFLNTHEEDNYIIPSIKEWCIKDV
jgi:hypothetical protein